MTTQQLNVVARFHRDGYIQNDAADSYVTWKTLLPDLPVDGRSHSGVAAESMDKKKTYSFAIQTSEGIDETPIGSGDVVIEGGKPSICYSLYGNLEMTPIKRFRPIFLLINSQRDI